MSDSSFKAGRWVAAVLALIALVGVFLFLIKDVAPKGEVRKVDGYTPWKKETLLIAETLPVQDGGRVKPLSSYAGFKMLGFHGARSMKIEGADGKNYTLTPIAWLMDSLYRPQLAVKLPTFRIDNSAVLEGIGVKTRGKRDRYSYEDLSAGREKLEELTTSYERIEKEKRDTVQTQTIDLNQNVREYETLLGHFAFARNGVVLRNVSKEGAPDQRAEFSLMLQTTGEIRNQMRAAQAKGEGIHPDLKSIVDQFQQAAAYAGAGPRLLPPADPAQVTWPPTGQVITDIVTGESKDTEAGIQDIHDLELTVRSQMTSEEEFAKHLTELKEHTSKRASARGEYEHVELEAKYYRANWFLNALVFYILGALCAFAMWGIGQGDRGPGKLICVGFRCFIFLFTRPLSVNLSALRRFLSDRSAVGKLTGDLSGFLTLFFTLVGLTLSVIAIVQRCIIMERPPVGNLYDTVIFIATTMVILSFIVELLFRRRLALGLAPILGTGLILLARLFEVGDAKDNMDPLVAVLASNFWLSTHVITIALGYSSGLLAAFLSFIYVLMRGLNLDEDDKPLRRALTRATYGVLCLTLFLSLVGTVLGGIWANYSWGRFWGWDPKENGALLIVLWTLAILHARLGGYLREWSLHFASLFTSCVVAFSWWHVNFFNTGLHNYGFTAGKATIWIFYSFILLVICFGAVCWAVEKEKKVIGE